MTSPPPRHSPATPGKTTRWRHRIRQWRAILALAAIAAGGTALAGPAAAADLRERCAAARQTADGQAICRQAVTAYPRDPAVRRDYAISLAFGGAYLAATVQFHAAARLAPNSHRAHYEVAWIHAFLGDYAPSIAPIERAMALRPGSLKYMRFAAIVYAVTRQRRKQFVLAGAAAAKGDPISMYDLAWMYADGAGTRRDFRRAVMWLTRAADRGHVVAMDNLADAYLNGKLGLARNRQKADYWARRAHKARED